MKFLLFLFLATNSYALGPSPVPPKDFDEIHGYWNPETNRKEYARIWVEEEPDITHVKMEDYTPLWKRVKWYSKKYGMVFLNYSGVLWVVQFLGSIYYLGYVLWNYEMRIFFSTLLIWLALNMIVFQAWMWLEKRFKR